MCDTAVRVLPGRVLFAKSSDRDANEAAVLTWVPAARHAPGARQRCTYIEIPQAPRTLAALLARPFWMWGAEIGANEAGVTIGNEAVFTNQPAGPPALTGMDLLRLAVERAESAVQAVELITGLLERHGQGGGCGYEDRSFTYHNSFIVADGSGAWRLETAGRRWAAEPVSGACSISNALTLDGFAQAHAEPLGVKTFGSGARGRRARTSAHIAGAEGLGDLRRLLRDHGHEDGPPWRWWNGTLGSVCMHGGGLLAASQTTSSWVAELRPEGARHQVTGTSAPCLSLFKPVSVTEPLALGPEPTGTDDGGQSLWWRWERLHRRGLADLGEAGRRIGAERDAVEARWEAEGTPPQVAFEEADALLERWLAPLEQQPLVERRPWAARRYWASRVAAACAPQPGRRTQ